MNFALLGPLRVTGDQGDLLPARAKQRALLAVLLLSANDVVPVERLLEALWGERSPPTAANALQGHVSALRKLLGPERIKTRPPGYVLAVQPGELDVERFERLLGACGRSMDAARRAALAAEALSLFRGEPLADFRYEPFAQTEIARLDELRRVALEARLEAELDLGGHAEAIAELERLAAADPRRERPRELLMLALYRAGRQADALALYRRTREAFVEELGLEPGPRLQELNRAILAQDPALEAQVLRQREPESPLPVPANRLVGRQHEIRAIRRLLLDDARLLTITGPGGTGKTRLALEAARELVDDFGGSVYFLQLAPLASAELLAPTIGDALGVVESAPKPLLATIARAIGDRRLLLVLDTFEHLLDGALLLAELLVGCPGLTVLVTSRSPLRLTGEHEYPLDPLPLDDAVELFRTRARAVAPMFSAQEEKLVSICERVDRLPLALELAAARVKILTADELLARLSGRLDVLREGARDLPDRQRTLRATIQWSHDLLGEDERQLFQRVAVFAGGCTLEAAERVCAAAEDTLGSLIDKSLIRRRDDASGSSRFWMLETVREYALEQLESSRSAPEVARAHAAFFLALAEEAAEELAGSGQRDALRRLDTETDNLRLALAWSLESEPSWAVRLAAALGRFWAMRGHVAEARRSLRAVVDLPQGASPAGLKALLASANFAAFAGDLAEAVAHYERGIEVARRAAPEQIPRFLTGLGQIALAHADFKRACGCFEEALALQRKADDAAGVAAALANLGVAVLGADDHEAAGVYLADSARTFREVGDLAGLAVVLPSLAYANHRRARFSEARAVLREALALSLELGEQLAAAWGLVVAAALAAEPAPERAARLLGAADAVRRRLGVSPDPFDAAVQERTRSTLRARLGEQAWERERAKGERLTLNEAVAQGVEEPDPVGLATPRRPFPG